MEPLKHPLAIGFIGRATSGKDTAMELASDIIQEYNPGPVCLHYNFAEPVYHGAAALFGGTVEDWKDQSKRNEIVICGKTRRELLQTLGTEYGRDIVGYYQTYGHFKWCPWTHKAYRMKDNLDLRSTLMYTSVRFLDEIDYIQTCFWRHILINVKRLGVQNMQHDSERLARELLHLQEGTSYQTYYELRYHEDPIIFQVYTIENNGTITELKEKIRECLKSLSVV